MMDLLITLTQVAEAAEYAAGGIGGWTLLTHLTRPVSGDARRVGR